MQLVCPACATKNRVPDERLGDGPVCGRCGGELMAAAPFALSDEHFAAVVEGTELPLLVDAWAAWCGPCRMMAPQFEAAARQRPGLRFAKLDTEAAPRTASALGIRSIPTLLLFHRGREIGRRSGAMPAAEILAWADATLARTEAIA